MMNDKNSEYWWEKNVRGVINELEKTRKQLDDQLKISTGLQNSVAMLNQDITILKQRLNVLQYGQVQGATKKCQ